jgi:GNAT superfamily N-acetyltransferase
MKGQSSLEIRDATNGDLAGIARVRLAIDRDAHDDSGADPGYCRHLIDNGRLLVGVEQGDVVGFAGAIDVGGCRLLADLFIDPAKQGTGLGRALLAEIFAGVDERFTFSSSDVRAMPIYARAGMLPHWPLLYMRGDRIALPMPPGASVESISADEAAAFEREVLGVDRSTEYRYWATRAGSVTLQARRGTEIIGVGAVLARRDMVRIEHMVAVDVDDLNVFTAIAHYHSQVDRVLAYVPGPRKLTRLLLDCGFHIVDSDTYMATSQRIVPNRLMVVHPGLA